jgi:molecular chaperone DnaK
VVQKRREEVDARNRADSMIYQTEKSIKEVEDKLSPDVKTKLSAAIERCRASLKGTDVSEIKNATDDLTSVWHEAAGQIYQQQAAERTTSSAASEPAGSEQKTDKEEVVDADYEVMDDEKEDS